MRFHRHSRSIKSSGNRGSTLPELLVVIAIVVMMFALVGPAISGLNTASNVTTAAYSIQGAIEQARMYAVANHTYTWVGLFEEDVSANAQSPAKSGVGRLVICIVASQDGTSIYNKTQAQSDSPSVQSLTASKLVQIGKIIKIDNVHVLDVTDAAVGKRPAGLIREKDLVGLTSEPLLFSFQYPLSGTAKYTFGVRPTPSANGYPVANGIIQFNPQGEAISDIGPVANPATNLEIAIQGTHGTQVGDSANVVALNVSGMTGQTTIYRP